MRTKMRTEEATVVEMETEVGFIPVPKSELVARIISVLRAHRNQSNSKAKSSIMKCMYPQTKMKWVMQDMGQTLSDIEEDEEAARIMGVKKHIREQEVVELQSAPMMSLEKAMRIKSRDCPLVTSEKESYRKTMDIFNLGLSEEDFDLDVARRCLRGRIFEDRNNFIMVKAMLGYMKDLTDAIARKRIYRWTRTTSNGVDLLRGATFAVILKRVYGITDLSCVTTISIPSSASGEFLLSHRSLLRDVGITFKPTNEKPFEVLGRILSACGVGGNSTRSESGRGSSRTRSTVGYQINQIDVAFMSKISEKAEEGLRVTRDKSLGIMHFVAPEEDLTSLVEEATQVKTKKETKKILEMWEILNGGAE